MNDYLSRIIDRIDNINVKVEPNLDVCGSPSHVLKYRILVKTYWKIISKHSSHLIKINAAAIIQSIVFNTTHFNSERKLVQLSL